MSIENLGQYLSTIGDRRCSGKVEHRLIDVLVITVCAVIACAESWDDIALYGRSKLAWLRTFLELPNGIPSHDTFWHVFMLIDPEAFEAEFATWVGSLTVGHARLRVCLAAGACPVPRPCPPPVCPTLLSTDQSAAPPTPC